MRFERGHTVEEWRAELSIRAEQVWGADRVEALTVALESAARAIEWLASEPLEPLPTEPDFVAGTPRDA